MREIGVGVIGFGLAARVFHCPFVSAVPGLRLRVIVQRNGDEAAKAYPEAKVVQSVEEMLGDPAIELVVVAVPNELHAEMGTRALEAGKHVVIDKPFAATSEAARGMIELAHEEALVLAPFHNRRWDGDFLTVKKLLAEGTLGRVVTCESHFDRYRPLPREGTWKEQGDRANGLLMDLGPHLVDQALALWGLPGAIVASVRTDRDGSAIEDAFDIALRYEVGGRGLMVYLRSSMLAAEYSPRFLIHGVNGSFRKWGLDPQEPRLVAGATVPQMGSDEVWGEEAEADWGTLTLAPDLAKAGELVRRAMPTERGDYRAFYANVRDAVLGVGQLEVTAEAGFNTVRVLELARQSWAEGRAVAFQ